ncbi:MAG: DUF3108 domain-containing protein [Alphaproteobacteria bacterium]
MKQTFLRHAVATLLFTLVATVHAWAEADWFTQGERLQYDITWKFLHAGKAEVLYRPEGQADAAGDAATYSIVARAWTTLYYPKLLERLRVSGSLNPETPFRPTEFEQMQVENNYKADKITVFDYAKGEARYDNLRNKAKGEGQQVLEINSQVRDILSTLYFMRKAADWNTPFAAVPILNLDRPYVLRVEVGAPEFMRTKTGKLTVRRVQPYLTPVGDGKKPKDQWTLWVTDDARRIPLRIDLVSRFGTFSATLTGVGTADSQSIAPREIPEKAPLF